MELEAKKLLVGVSIMFSFFMLLLIVLSPYAPLILRIIAIGLMVIVLAILGFRKHLLRKQDKKDGK